MAKEIGVGNAAPDFSLSDEAGNTVKLSDLKGNNIIIFFYPKANTFGCTKEACSFRDQFAKFPAGTVVLGISTDTAADQKAFKDQYCLNYPLLCDVESNVRKSFGGVLMLSSKEPELGVLTASNFASVPDSLFGLIPGRVTYVIDKAGIVRAVYNSQVFATSHPQKALEAVAALG
jgi:peroxiredoxin Q/BCP